MYWLLKPVPLTPWAEFVRDVGPGEIVVIDKDGIKTIKNDPQPRRLCLFEALYFARPDSRVDGKSIYLSRNEAGRILAGASCGCGHSDWGSGFRDSGCHRLC